MIKGVGIDWNKTGKIGDRFGQLNSGAVECIVPSCHLVKKRK